VLLQVFEPQLPELLIVQFALQVDAYILAFGKGIMQMRCVTMTVRNVAVPEQSAFGRDCR
jgi:hypothetical protein